MLKLSEKAVILYDQKENNALWQLNANSKRDVLKSQVVTPIAQTTVKRLGVYIITCLIILKIGIVVV